MRARQDDTFIRSFKLDLSEERSESLDVLEGVESPNKSIMGLQLFWFSGSQSNETWSGVNDEPVNVQQLLALYHLIKCIFLVLFAQGISNASHCLFHVVEIVEQKDDRQIRLLVSFGRTFQSVHQGVYQHF
jgi:hypothetical protein